MTATTPAAPRRVRRWAIVAVAIVVFLAVSALLARWLGTENAERDAILRVLQAQARGDAAAMERLVDCPDAACRAQLRANAARLRGNTEVTIVRLDSGTSHAIGSKTAPTRVVWLTPDRLTTVQCAVVRRSGTPLSGRSVTLLGLSAPIGREAGCR